MSSAKKFGGRWQDYLPIHQWFDDTKTGMADARHRAMRHHAEGIGWALEKFGASILVTVGTKKRAVSVRMIAEQHIREDLGHIPTMADWLREMPIKSWMVRAAMSRPDKGQLRHGDPEGSYDPTKEITNDPV